ncbi:MAG: hypothetical protein ACREA9_10825 [Pyrinomonadaceae bacterium]
MKSGIQHFIWGYQPHYRTHVKVAAESALKRLDEGLGPEAFLVGILNEDRPNRYPACVEPEQEHWIESEAFDGAVELAASLRENYIEGQMYHSLPLQQQRVDAALHRRSIRDAILQIIELHPTKPTNRTFFVSVPTLVEGYLVSAVLSVETDVLNSYHRLTSGEVSIHEYRKMPVARSLIDGAIDELLTQASEGLLRPDPGLSNEYREAEETIRSAGRRLASNTAFRTNQHALDADYFFYDACDKISLMKYEQVEGRGRLVLAQKDYEDLCTQISFRDNVRLEDHRRVRKLLELASSDGALHTDSEYVFGLLSKDVPTSTREDVFEVIFLGHHHWELRHAGQVLMGVRFGQPYLPNLIGYESKLRQDLPRLFPGIDGDATELLVSLVRQTEEERHGTLMIVSAEAAAEAVRLRNQATPIEPCLLTPELLAHLTGIDGAVLVDTHGTCHAIGVILDGLATSEGDPARGARFNSAVRYVQSANDRQVPTLAVVVSEDGGVDLIPDMRPMIRRSLLVSALSEIEEISRSATIRRRRYSQLYDYLRLSRFYLLPDDCERINLAIQAIERRCDEEDPMRMKVVREHFDPDSGMDASFYYESEDSVIAEDDSKAAPRSTMDGDA